jgi:hypothetical protein
MGLMPMTDEERQRLCHILRTTECWTDTTDLLLRMAADEIERLASELRLEISARDRAYDAARSLYTALAQSNAGAHREEELRPMTEKPKQITEENL